MLAVENLGEFSGLRRPVFEVIANCAQLVNARPEGSVIKGAARILQAALQLNALGRTQIIGPLQVGPNVLPGTPIRGIVLDTGITLQNLIVVMDVVIEDSLLQERLPGQGFVIAQLPAQARPDIHTAPGRILAT